MFVGKDGGVHPVPSSSPHGNLPSVLLAYTASGDTRDLQPAAKPVLDPQTGKGQARLPIAFRENMLLIIFSHSQQLSLAEIVLVIIAVIIILIQISNLSKYYPVDAASLLPGYRWRRCRGPCPARCAGTVGTLVRRVLPPQPAGQLHRCPSARSCPCLSSL